MGLQEDARRRILVLDGAMGTMIQSYGLGEADFRGTRFAGVPGQMKGNNDILNLTRPDVVSDIHRRYLEAGADIIETNTFSSNAVSMQDYHVADCVRELNLEGARLARRLADEYSPRVPGKRRYVAGSIGPTNKSCSMSRDVDDPAARELDFATLRAAYFGQISALLEGGVDALLVETIFDTLNAKAALMAAEEAMQACGREVPVMLSATVADRSGRVLSGQTLAAWLVSMCHYPLFSVGLNCSFGARELKPFLEQLSEMAPCFVSAYPNAGLPNSLGQYDQSPEEMEREVREYVEEGLVNIVGGCCGTTDAFIARFPPLVSGKRPRAFSEKPRLLRLSGLEVLEAKPEVRFINVGERCNVAGSRKFLRLIREKNYAEALAIARKQVEDGALVLDINMDDGLLDARAEMEHFVRLLSAEPDIARVPFMIDSSEWEVIRAGLENVQGKAVVNSISLKEGEEAFLAKARLIRRYGAAVVVMAFDEQGQADTYERKIEVCARAYRLLTAPGGANFPPEDIIFDPNVLAVATGIPEHDRYALDFIQATRWIRAHLPYAHVSGGVSNLSFAFRGNNYLREAIHAVFLYHALEAGMDMGIVNPAASVLYSELPHDLLELIEDVVLYRRADAAERLLAAAQELHSGAEAPAALGRGGGDGWRSCPLDERLKRALVKGDGQYLEEDLHEALGCHARAVDIIEGPLMEGMTEVGKLFGAGKMFLPQVVKTARTMKQAVGILQPYIEAGRVEGAASAGRVLLATVKGDVHDIGKNIVGVVLGCNNYEVIDLGTMVPAEEIVRKAREERVDFVALSGLITPSLEEMVHVARLMEAGGLRIPLLIGGATTSRLHTALRIAPEYGAPVVWVKDAAQDVLACAALQNPRTREAYVERLEADYARLRADYGRRQAGLLSLEEARRRKPDFF